MKKQIVNGLFLKKQQKNTIVAENTLRHPVYHTIIILTTFTRLFNFISFKTQPQALSSTGIHWHLQQSFDLEDEYLTCLRRLRPTTGAFNSAIVASNIFEMEKIPIMPGRFHFRLQKSSVYVLRGVTMINK